jgi:hypothetical protein
MWEKRGTMWGLSGPSRFPYVGFANIPDLIFFQIPKKLDERNLVASCPPVPHVIAAITLTYEYLVRVSMKKLSGVVSTRNALTKGTGLWHHFD